MEQVIRKCQSITNLLKCGQLEGRRRGATQAQPPDSRSFLHFPPALESLARGCQSSQYFLTTLVYRCSPHLETTENINFAF